MFKPNESITLFRVSIYYSDKKLQNIFVAFAYGILIGFLL